MARIIYGLSSEGRGHRNRVAAVSSLLRARGHEISYCCGGSAGAELRAAGEDVIDVPTIGAVYEGNRARRFRSSVGFVAGLARWRGIVRATRPAFEERRPDLVISDFEPFSHRVAASLDVPVISLCHQQVVGFLRDRVPARHWPDLFATDFAVSFIAPKAPALTIITALTEHESKPGLHFVGPILRPEILAAEPTQGEHLLVYFNFPAGLDELVGELERVDAPVIAYNLRPEASRHANIEFKVPARDTFLTDLSSCRAVVATAGYTLMSESLWLKKPMLVAPNEGVLEQVVNAWFLRDAGFGAMAAGPIPDHAEIEAFLGRESEFRAALANGIPCGNERAVELIQSILAD
jgi:uncharacterized protein (TIGR00661 family)